MKINKSIIFCASLAILTAACGISRDNTAAIVNGTKIAKKTYQGTLDNLVLQQKRINPNFVDNEQTRLVLGKTALENLITNEVLAQEAAKAHITVDEKEVEQSIQNLKKLVAVDENGQPITKAREINKKFNKKLKEDGVTLKQLKNNIRKELLAKRFLNDLSSKQKIELSEDLLKRFYNETNIVLSNDKKKIQTLTRGDLALVVPFATEVGKATAQRASVSSVFLATPTSMPKEEVTKKKALANKIVQELKDKKITFVQAIQQYSDDKNALRTNGEQTVLYGSLPASLDKKIFEASLGKVIGPLTEADGIYILRVNQKRAENTLTYAQLRNDIARYLGSWQLNQNLQQQVKGLVEKAKVEILLPQYQLNVAQADAQK